MVRFISAVLLAAFAVQPLAAADTPLQPGETLLEVQAEGRATYSPDAAFLNIGVVSTGTTAGEATDGNARSMVAVVAALRKAGVEARYVRTQQISVEPRFARSSPQDYQGQAEITGYVARNSVVVTIVKLGIAPEVIAAAFAAGANSVSGPSLGSMDPEKGVASARSDALAKARSEADAYARGLGMHVARILRVNERGNAARTLEYALSGVRNIIAPSAPMAPPVSAGELQRTITVWIDFTMVPDRP